MGVLGTGQPELLTYIWLILVNDYQSSILCPNLGCVNDYQTSIFCPYLGCVNGTIENSIGLCPMADAKMNNYVLVFYKL